MGVAEYKLTAHPPKELKALLPSEREMKTQLQVEFKSKNLGKTRKGIEKP